MATLKTDRTLGELLSQLQVGDAQLVSIEPLSTARSASLEAAQQMLEANRGSFGATAGAIEMVLTAAEAMCLVRAGATAELTAEFEIILWAYLKSRARQPPCVYHYTDLEGMKSILEHRKLWATHSAFMNDSQEGVFAHERFASVLRDVAPDRAEAIAAILNDDDLIKKNGVYLTCFSAEPDLLSQWRAYAKDGFGFALGIDAARLPAATLGGGWSGPVMHEVIYPRAEDTFFSDLARFAVKEHQQASEDGASRRRLAFTLWLLRQGATRFKQPGFSEEREWRLVWLPSLPSADPAGETNEASRAPKSLLRFRSSARGFVPYLEWPVDDGDEGSLIRRIVIGPKRGAERWVLEEFLDRLGYTNVQIVCSEVSYR